MKAIAASSLSLAIAGHAFAASELCTKMDALLPTQPVQLRISTPEIPYEENGQTLYVSPAPGAHYEIRKGNCDGTSYQWTIPTDTSLKVRYPDGSVKSFERKGSMIVRLGSDESGAITGSLQTLDGEEVVMEQTLSAKVSGTSIMFEQSFDDRTEGTESCVLPQEPERTIKCAGSDTFGLERTQAGKLRWISASWTALVNADGTLGERSEQGPDVIAEQR